MWLVIFGLVCFWSGAAALVAYLCGWPVLPLMLLMGAITGIVLVFAGSLCQAAGTWFPEDHRINIQAYFGGTFRLKPTMGGRRLQD